MNDALPLDCNVWITRVSAPGWYVNYTHNVSIFVSQDNMSIHVHHHSQPIIDSYRLQEGHGRLIAEGIFSEEDLTMLALAGYT